MNFLAQTLALVATLAGRTRAVANSAHASDAAMPPRRLEPVLARPKPAVMRFTNSPAARVRPTVTPWEIAKPLPGVVPANVETMAADQDLGGLYTYAAENGTWGEGLRWFGYPYLAELSQRPEYRRIAETIAKEMTRKWIRLQASGSDDSKTDKVRQLELAFKKYRVQEVFRRAAELDGFFGRAQIFIDMGDSDPVELTSTLVRKPTKIKQGSLRRLTVLEPMWSYPTDYNSVDPLAPDFYLPRFWYVQGRKISASRLLTFVAREMPDMLKPAYAFGGLSLSQMAHPYIENWIRTRQSVSDMLHSFSVSGLKTNMAGTLAEGGEDALFKRGQMFNAMRDSRGFMLVDKDTEEFFNVSTPLGTLDHLQAQSQEHMSSVAGIPLIVLLGITPSGLNASSDGEIKVWNSWIEAQQEQLFTRPLTRVLEIVQLSEFGEIDPEIGFRFEPLSQLDEEKLASVRKTEADTAAVYIQAGVLSPHEERARIAADEDSIYAALDLADLPDPQPPPDPAAEGDPAAENDNDPPEPRVTPREPGPGRPEPVDRAAGPRPTGPGRPDIPRPKAAGVGGDADFEEGEHDRADNGRFSGAGGNKAVDKAGAPLVLHHGTNREFDEHDPVAKAVNRTNAALGTEDIPGIYFTSDRTAAANYAAATRRKAGTGKPNVISAHLAIHHPLDITNAIKRHRRAGLSFGAAKREALKDLDRNQHDGVIFRGDSVNSSEYVVFDPNQVRRLPKQAQDAWNENDHTRGQPENAGEFGSGGGSAKPKPAAKAKPAVGTTKSPTKPAAGTTKETQAKAPPGSPQYNPATTTNAAGEPTGMGAGKVAASKAGMKPTLSDGKARTQANGAPLPAHIEALRIPPAWQNVHYNDAPGATLLAQGMDAKGRVQSIYSAGHTAAAAAAKFARIHALMQQFNQIMGQNDSMKRDPKRADEAECLDLVMTMGIRPGSEGDTGSAYESFGATTLQGRHVVTRPDGSMALTFVPGKKHGESITLPVTNPAIAEMLRRRATAAGPNGKLFNTDEKKLSDHAHMLDGGIFKTKDFRTHLGTKTAAEIVAKMPKPTDPKSYAKAVKTVATHVANTLGNTPSVALESYISPTIFAGWQL